MAREDEDKDDTGPIYKVKVVSFLGRQVPIVLQNDNGPCPLLAICNVLLLRNHVNLSTDISEISSSRLLSLIAERLIDTNVLNGTKSADYERNLQQNIADAMQLLPRLRTGIDVNLRFRHIHDFEFTPECAIFDLFDIGLVHGWLFDPQDKDTSEVIGSDSYNTLQERLVAFEACKMSEDSDLATEEPTVDFAAATTATLGVPTPLPREMWSSETSFEEVANDTNQEESAHERKRKGDSEEAAMLMQALQLSESEAPYGLAASSTDEGELAKNGAELERHLSDDGHFSSVSGTSVCSSGHLITPLEEIDMPEEVAEIGAREENSMMHEPGVGDSTERNHSSMGESGVVGDQVFMEEDVVENGYVMTPEMKSSPSIFTMGDDVDRPVNLLDVGEDNFGIQDDLSSKDAGLDVGDSPDLLSAQKISDPVSDEQGGSLNNTSAEPTDVSAEGSSGMVLRETGPALSVVGQQNLQVLSVGPGSSSSRSFGSSGLDDEEPLYEGEDDFANQGGSTQGDNEPLYEGEVILAGQASGSELDPEQSHGREASSGSQKMSVTVSDREGRIIKQFLGDNASQLTIYGLFSLVENLKEHELCVFFRNNHFSTLFKRSGKLLLLATDQGYLHQPVVWEQLESVDNDTVFLKGDFTLFTAEEHNSGPWDMLRVPDKTADFMPTHGGVEQDSDLQLQQDLQLALALQQQEMDQQQQAQQQQPLQLQSSQQQQLPQQPRALPQSSSSLAGTTPPASTPGSNRMFVGPSRGQPLMPKQEPAKKEKCTIM